MADGDALSRLGLPRRTFAGRLLGLALGALVIASVVALVVLWRERSSAAPSRWETAPITRGELVATVTATGTLVATNTVQIGAEVSGRVASVMAQENDEVAEGQVLVELDPDQLDAAIREARANVAAADAAVRLARATLGEATRTHDRASALTSRGLLPEAEREQAETARERADAEVASAIARRQVARAALERALENRDRAVIRSPIDGVVLTRSVEPGQAIAASFQTPVLFEVAESLSRMELRVDVDEADVGQVRSGQRATFTVDAFPDRAFEATIERVHLAPRTVQGVVTYEAVLEVDNQERLLRPGMTATATIITHRHQDVLLVPDPALRFSPPSGGPFSRSRRDDVPTGPTIWTLDGERPVPHSVRVLATNGTQSVIEGEAAVEGRAVLIGVASEQ